MADTILPILRAHISHPDLARLVDEPSTTMRELDLDGVDLAGICMEIEDTLGVTITDEEMHRWNTVADVVEFAAGRVVA